MFRITSKEIIFKLKVMRPLYYRPSSTNTSDSSSGSSDEDNNLKTKKTSKQNVNKNPALEKLNTVLMKMIEEDVAVKKTPKSLEFARAVNKFKKNKENEEKLEELDGGKTTESKLKSAAKEVAKAIGGNEKQTESELLQKLLTTLPDPQRTSPSKNIADIIKGMTIDRESKSSDTSRAQQVKMTLQYHKGNEKEFSKIRVPYKKRIQRTLESMRLEKIDLFGAEPLGIFTSEVEEKGVVNKTWEKLYKRELKLTVTHPPTNYFQEMILWTDQGKIWKFPIDNEQDMDERFVPFTEHIFLEKHLEPWCPKKGPIRHFMELVCVGLSKNPYFSVDEKKGHIEWYKNYFSEKEPLLKEVGAIPAGFTFDKDQQKQIEE